MNRGDEGLLAKTDASSSAGKVLLAVDFVGEQLVCWVEIGDLVFSRESALDFDCDSSSVIRVHY